MYLDCCHIIYKAATFTVKSDFGIIMQNTLNSFPSILPPHLPTPSYFVPLCWLRIKKGHILEVKYHPLLLNKSPLNAVLADYL